MKKNPGEGYAPKGMILRRFGLESGMVFGKLRECMNVFITSIPNELEKKRNMRIRSGF